eukprot:scaffold55632_cov56-Attheya_sp.AAC.4
MPRPVLHLDVSDKFLRSEREKKETKERLRNQSVSTQLTVSIDDISIETQTGDSNTSEDDQSSHSPSEDSIDHSSSLETNPNRRTSHIKRITTSAQDVGLKITTSAQASAQALERAIELQYLKQIISDVSSSDTGGVIKTMTLMAALLLLVLLALISIPLHSVNAGIESNRWFLYGMVPCFSVIGMMPWVETFDFVVPDIHVPRHAKVLSVLLGTAFLTLVNACISERWGLNVFPIPFTNFLMGTVSLPITMGVAYALTPKTKDAQVSKIFKRYGKMSLWFVLSVVLALLWAVSISYTQGSKLQYLLAIAFVLLKFICKRFLFGPTVINISPYKCSTVLMIVDMFYATVQVVTTPYMDNYVTIFLQTLMSAVGLLLSYYGVGDRFGILIDMIKKQEMTKQKVSYLLFAHVRDIYQASVKIQQKNTDTTKEGGHILPFDDLETGLENSDHNENVAEDAGVVGKMSKFTKKMVDTSISKVKPVLHVPEILQFWHEESSIPEEVWIQQMLHNVFDGVGSTSAALVVRFQFVISMLVMRQLPNEEHLNTSSAELSDAQWYSSFLKQVVGLIGTVIVLAVVGYVYEKCTFNSDGEEADQWHITMTGVLGHIYSKENFLFLFLWFLATGMFIWSIMFTHFGVDFTLKFEWLSCRQQFGEMEWPSCHVAD